MSSEVELIFKPAQASAVLIYFFGDKEEFDPKEMRKLFGCFVTREKLQQTVLFYRSHGSLSAQASTAQIKNKPQTKKVRDIDKVMQIGKLFHESDPPLSLQEIGNMFDLTRERVRQIVVKYDTINNITGKRDSIATTKFRKLCKDIDPDYIDKNKDYKTAHELAAEMGIEDKILLKWAKKNKVGLHKVNVGSCSKCGKLLWCNGTYCNDCNYESRLQRIKEWSHTEKAKASRAEYAKRPSTIERTIKWRANRNIQNKDYVYCPICHMPFPFDGTCNNGLLKHICRKHSKEEYTDILNRVRNNSITFEAYVPEEGI